MQTNLYDLTLGTIHNDSWQIFTLVRVLGRDKELLTLVVTVAGFGGY